ncbi:trace amine-associated receptor 13c-like [Clupea harengus]|uniref:Trace amine-associated receptor 13c-like n=1 Tax=Clupea harengus TaxID=7950 RepID=A0A6P8GEV1_CLUHA|nr:trace amine-associated receptor 13c-like [Clupea harengus]
MNVSTVDELIFCSNVTCQDVQRTPFAVFLYVFRTAGIILTVCGNFLVIISISHFKQLHTPTNFLILSLATADMMVGVTVLPIQLIHSDLCMQINYVLCYLYLMCSSHFTFLSIYNVSLISLDRLYALSYPFQYSNKVTFNLISTVVCLNWLTSFGYNLAVIYFNGPGTVLCFGECNIVESGLWASIDLFFVFILPCSVILLSYMKLFVIVRKHAKSINLARGKHTSGNAQNGECARKASERKAATTLGILVIVFVACLLPYFLCVVFSDSIPGTLLMQLLEGAVLILLLNSAINPMIYALFYPWFRKCAKHILTLYIFNPDSSLANVFTKSG